MQVQIHQDNRHHIGLLLSVEDERDQVAVH